VGSARVWDAATRARHGAAAENGAAPPPPAPGLAFAEIETLITAIVQVTLETMLSSWDEPRRSALAQSLRERLVSAVLPELAAAPAPAPLPVEAAAEELAPPEVELVPAASEPQAPPDPALASPVALLLLQRLGRLGGPLLARPGLCPLLVRLVLGTLEAPSEQPTASEEELRRLDVLQRRTFKLERSLQEIRSALTYVKGLERVDTGLASIYRAVQGLAEDAPDRERKRSALDGIFQANLHLQKRGASPAV